MKKIKKYIYDFILYVYCTYIKEEWDLWNKPGKIFIYPFWFIRSFILWVISPIFIIEFQFKKSKYYKKIQKIQKSPEFQKEFMKTMNKFNI